MSKLINSTGTNQESFSLGVGNDKVELRTIDGVLYFRNIGTAWQQVASTGAISSVTINEWAPSTQYFEGQLIRYQGSLFAVANSHQSSSTIETDSLFLNKVTDFDSLLTIDVDTESSPRQLTFFDSETVVCEGTASGSFIVRLPPLANVDPGQTFRIYNRCNKTITVADSTGTGVQSLAVGEVSAYVKNNTLDWIASRIEQSTTTSGGGTGVPSGGIIAWPHDVVPAGYLECDGSAHFKVDFPSLYSVVGDKYGSTDTTFNVPDYRGYVLRGWSNGSGNDLHASTRTDRGDGISGDQIGTKQGSYIKEHNHSNAIIDPGHSHTAGSIGVTFIFGTGGPSTLDQGAGAGASPKNTVNSSQANLTVNVTGVTNSGSTTVGDETIMKNLNVMWIIKT